jgi:hypothetical protein
MNFILLGQHRSGTSYVLDLIRHNEHVNTINEPFSMHLEFFRNNESAWHEIAKEPALHDDIRNLTSTICYIRDLKNWLTTEKGVNGFKETALFEKYDWLNSYFNFDSTLILIRDPRAVIASVLSRKMNLSWWDYRHRLSQYYGISNIKDLSDIEICAMLWKKRNSYLKQIMSGINCLCIKLESVVNEPIETLNKVMHELSLSIDECQLKFIGETSKDTRNSAYSNFRRGSDVIKKWHDFFSSSEVDRINQILKIELIEYDYDL